MTVVQVISNQKRCACGYTKDAPQVAQEPEYTLWGWILLTVLGIGAKPDHISFRCTICRQRLGISRDPKLLTRESKDAR
ncbi:MAG TPA: hypothetical protein VIF62_11470 [Labilithrix sp.]|jgi:hypothetical protein